MASTDPSSQHTGHLLSLSATLNRAETVKAAVTHAIELAETVLSQPVVSVCEYDTETDTLTAIESPTRFPDRADDAPAALPEPVLERVRGRTNDSPVSAAPEPVVDTDPPDSLQTAVFVPVGPDWILRLGTTEPDGFGEAEMTIVEGIAANLEAALNRLGGREANLQRRADQAEYDATALRRLNELTVNAENTDDTIERLLSLGCEYFGLDTGILSHVDAGTYEVKSVVDATGVYETGAVYDLEETMCEATLSSDRTEPLAFTDVPDTDHRNHPAAKGVCAYIAVPVIVGGEAYGTVNFSMAEPRAESFRTAEREFVTHIAEWIGREIERRRRFEQLEQYETILEAVDDPVYALDTDGQFTFVNAAAEREFGYGTEVIGEHVSVGMDEEDIEWLQEQIKELLGTDKRSTTAEFELRTADGKRRTVENRLALIGDDEFHGTAGVLRDITTRKERERKLESFQRAVEEAADGIAILENDEYVYVDQTHVEMYGFDTKDDLLGETWRELYDDEEVARLEEVAFPALEDGGFWRGRVTGSRPDGSTFPAELSLTIVDDGRLVCTVRDETERRERERELELKERAMNEATVGIQITDPTQEDNPLVYVNDGFERMTGYTSEDAIGRNPRFLQGEDSDPEQVARLREAVDSEEPVSLELKNHRKDGTPYWSRISVTPVTDEDGTVTNYVGIQQDVTERIAQKRDAEKRVELLERMYEATTDPETEFDEKISQLLEAGCDYLDVPYGFLTRIEMGDDSTAGTQRILESVGSHDRLQPGESGPLSESYCQQTIDYAGPLAITNAAESELVDDLSYEAFGLDAYIGGNVVVDSDVYGTLCFASDEPRESTFDEFGRTFVSLLGQWAGYEIERRDTREELRQQQERLELTLSGTKTGLADWDLTDDTVSWNETLVDMVGRDIQTFEEFEELVHPDDRQRVQSQWERMLETGEPWVGDVRIRCADDTYMWQGTRAVPTYDDAGNPVRVLAVTTDISDRKAEERERRRNERRFESLFDDPGMLVGLLDTDGTLLDVNATAMEYVEGTAAALQGEPFWETPWWNHSEELQSELREWISRAASGEYVEYSAVNQTVDGERFYVDGAIRPVTAADGTVTSLLVSARDVTEREQQRQELRDRQRKLDLVLSNTDTSVAELDIENGEVQWDNMLGENEIGSPETLNQFFETIHPDDRERVRSAVGEMVAGDEPLTIEFRFVDVEDSVVWVAAEAVPVVDDEGTPTGRVVGIATDITDLKRREQALEDSQQRYQALLQAAPDPIFIADAETGEIVEANAAAEELRGQSRDHLVGRHQTELHPEGNPDLYEDAFKRAIDGTSTITELPDGSQPELCTSDGETVPVEISAASVSLPDGPVLYGVFRDVSDRKERERELELKERAMNEANVGITISDPDREDNPLIYVNDGFVDQTGYTREEVLERNCRFLQGDDRDQPALDALRDAIAAEEPTTVELRNYRKDGEQFWNRLSVTPVYDERATLTNYVGIQQDVTAEKTREQRMRALHGTTRKLLEADEEDEAVTKALKTLVDELDFHLAGVYLREGDELVKTATAGPTPGAAPDRVERGRAPLWEAIDAGESVVIEDYAALDDGIERGDTSKGAYVPIADNGVVVVGAADSTRLDESEQRLVEVLAGNLASVLDTLARQRELFEEREQFRLLTESVDEYAFLTVDENRNVQTWNAGAENLFGYDADTAIGMSISELHPESKRESTLPERLIQQARIAGESADEGWRVRADGSEFYADVRYAPLESDDGEFRGYAKVVRDMTERRRQQRRTERFVEEANDVVTIVDPEGVIEYASGSAGRILGYDPDDLVGENLFDILHPESREETMETFFASIEDGDADPQVECRIESGDNGWLNVEGHCRNMLDDDAIGGMLLYLRDVTESKERARRFESIFNQTFQFTGLLEPDGTVIEANDAALDFGGFERDDIVGDLLYDVPWFTHSESVRDNNRDAIKRAANGEFVRYETEVQGAEGLATIDFSVKPVTDEDNDVALIVAEGRDITAQQQQKHTLEVMWRVMRHNMRNDLTKVRGWAQVMSEEEDAESRAEQFETIERILDKWESMTEKMSNIRQLSQSQSSEWATADASSLIEEAASPVRSEEDSATILTEVPDKGTIQVQEPVSKAVRELVENAVDAGEDATVAVELTCPEADWIEIRVRDDGPGLPEMEAGVLETGEETALNHGGGLGLWMVRTVVTQAGGDVAVESTTDGTEVRLRLPRVRQTETPE